MASNSQCCHTKNTIHMSPMVLQCFLSAVVENRPSAAFWFDHQPRPTESRRRGEGAVRTRGADSPASVTLSGVCPSGETGSHLARSSLLALCPGTGPGRWLRDQLLASTGKLSMPKGLAAAPKNGTLRMDGPTHPRSCRQIPVPLVLLNLLRGAPPVHASAFAASLYFRSWSGRWSRAGPAASTRKLLMQEGLDPASRSCTFQNGPSSPPKKLQPTHGLQCATPTSDGTQTVSATQNENAATWKDSDLRPCSSSA